MVTEPEESNEANGRKRADSNAGNSDSDLSESWNIVDLDTNNQDFPSSDGESVEVIDAEDESTEQVIEPESDGVTLKETNQLVPQRECPVVPVEEQKQSILQNVEQTLVREETLKTTFCQFFLIAISAVLISNLAFMAAENIFYWNTDMNIGLPSFLQDLPTTPKASQQSIIPNLFQMTDSEDVKVVSVDDTLASERVVVKDDRNQKREVLEDNKYRYTSHFAVKQDSYFVNEHEPLLTHKIYKTLKYLKNITSAGKTHTNFDSTFLILDALQIGLNDLEEVIAETPELYNILNQQRSKLDKTLAEIEIGVTRTMERLASKILNKVQNLERQFENQWCKLEKNGHGDSLKGIFYECEDSKAAKIKKAKRSKNKHKKNKYFKETDVFAANNLQYKVDKDSTGKTHSTGKSNNEESNNFEYFKLVSNDKNFNEEPQDKLKIETYKNPVNHKHQNRKKYAKTFTGKDQINENKNKQTEKYNNNKNPVNHKNQNHKKNAKTFKGKDQINEKKNKQTEKYNNNKESTSNNKSKKESWGSEKVNYFRDPPQKGEKHVNHKNQNRKKYAKTLEGKIEMFEIKNKHAKSAMSNNNNNYIKSTSDQKFKNENSSSEKKHYFRDTYQKGQMIRQHKQQNHYNDKMEQDFYPEDLIRQYIKDNCKKRLRSEDHPSYCFNKLKRQFKEIHSKMHKEMFNSIYDEYCKSKDDNIKWNKRTTEEDYKKSEHNIRNYLTEQKNIPVVIEDSSLKNIFKINILDTYAADDPEKIGNKVTTNQPKAWSLSYKEPTLSNNSKLNVDWFIKLGEFRTKTRWLQQRSDWLFDRASQRRSHPQPVEPSRRKNWFFRRAWARQNCLFGTADPWC